MSHYAEPSSLSSHGTFKGEEKILYTVFWGWCFFIFFIIFSTRIKHPGPALYKLQSAHLSRRPDWELEDVTRIRGTFHLQRLWDGRPVGKNHCLNLFSIHVRFLFVAAEKHLKASIFFNIILHNINISHDCVREKGIKTPSTRPLEPLFFFVISSKIASLATSVFIRSLNFSSGTRPASVCLRSLYHSLHTHIKVPLTPSAGSLKGVWIHLAAQRGCWIYWAEVTGKGGFWYRSDTE